MASVEGCSLALSSMEGARSEIDLAALVETYSSLLFRVAHSVLRSRAEAEDVVQDVFVRVLEHRRSLSAVRDMRARRTAAFTRTASLPYACRLSALGFRLWGWPTSLIQRNP